MKLGMALILKLACWESFMHILIDLTYNLLSLKKKKKDAIDGMENPLRSNIYIINKAP